MAAIKNRGIFRAVGLDQNTTEQEFKDLLLSKFTDDEKKTITISKLNLAPCPTNGGETQSAIFKFKPAVPAFLHGINKKNVTLIDKNGELIEIDPDFWGLTQLYPTSGRISIDVVALTGLNAHAYGSWSGVTSDGTNPMWLQDFLSKEKNLGPHCRSMIYGYNAKTAANATHTTDDYVEGFLRELTKARSEPEEKSRPLVLLGHSYGGLIISHAFVTASWNHEYKSIYHSAIRILCFGVPYRGISLEDVGRQVNSNKEKFSQGIELLKCIEYEGGRITSNTKQFRHLMKKTKTKIVSFYETLHTRKVEKVEKPKPESGDQVDATQKPAKEEDVFGRIGDYTLVVSKDSAVLGIGEDLEEEHDTDGDHSTIVKFTNKSNRTYTTITRLLKDLIKIGADEVEKRKADDARIEQWQQEIAQSVAPKGQDSEQEKYIRSQLLRIAAHAGLNILVEKLLEKGADPNMQAKDPKYERWFDTKWYFDDDVNLKQMTPEQKARSEKDQHSVAKVLESDLTALALAVKRGNPRIVKLLLKAGANPNLPCSDYKEGRTPLHEACRRGLGDIAQYLLMHKADVNAKTSLYGTTPLHEMAFTGAELVHTLAHFKADLNAKKDHTGETPLHIAARRGHARAVYDLTKRGADRTALDRYKSTPLHAAAREGHKLAVIALLADNKDQKFLDLQDDEGRTALHYAVDEQHKEVVQILLEKDANREIETEYGDTALQLALDNKDVEIADLLR